MANEPFQIDPLLPGYTWNPAARDGLGAYIDSRGRIVPPAVIRAELDRILDGISAEAYALGEQYLNGEISEDEWYLLMLALIKSSHLIAAAMERGGWAQMTYADYGRVGRVVESERGYLDSFLEGLTAGTALLGGALLVRAMLYIQAARRTFHQFADQTAAAVSAAGRPVFERRLLDPGARHCRCCVDEAAKGPQPLGTLLQIGDCTCRANCRCRKVHIDENGKEIG